MDIQREEHGRKGAFFIDENGEWVAELTYVNNGDNTITIDHTEVDEDKRGGDLGKDLVAAAVEYARENGFKVKLQCPFAKKVIDSTPGHQDVLA